LNHLIHSLRKGDVLEHIRSHHYLQHLEVKKKINPHYKPNNLRFLSLFSFFLSAL
jgi:hypothetical protein